MATVNPEQSAENMEYVRRLLKQSNPSFPRNWNRLWTCGTGAGVTDMLRDISATKPRSAV